MCKNYLAFWRERRAGRCKATRRRRCGALTTSNAAIAVQAPCARTLPIPGQAPSGSSGKPFFANIDIENKGLLVREIEKKRVSGWISRQFLLDYRGLIPGSTDGGGGAIGRPNPPLPPPGPRLILSSNRF